MKKFPKVLFFAMIISAALIIHNAGASADNAATAPTTTPTHEVHLQPTVYRVTQENLSAKTLRTDSPAEAVDEDRQAIALNCAMGTSNREMLFNFFVANGYSQEAAAGIIGNLVVESGGINDIKLNAVESNGEGVGMVQWSYDRKANFLAYCDDCGAGWPNTHLKIQADFLLKELEGEGVCQQWIFAGTDFGYSIGLDVSLESFKNCSDVQFAAEAFCANFERCYEYNSNMAKRILCAEEAYREFAK